MSQQQVPPPGQGVPPPAGYQQGPAAAYPPAYGQPTATTMVVTTPVVMAQSFRESPVAMSCPHCRAQITTSVQYVTGTFAWLICGLLLLFGLWLGCCLIPFCVNGCKDCIHSCPNCRQQVGVYRRM